MTKTKKLLSVVMAVLMLFGCMGLNAFAFDWPQDLEAGTPTFIGTSVLKSVEIPVGEKFTTITEDAEFTVYYTTEDLGDSYDIITLALKAEAVGTVHYESAYLAENVLHIDLSGLELSEEGYYHILISGGSLTGEDCTNVTETTAGVEYAYASLNVLGKLQAIIGYVLSMITNLLSNGAAY